MLRSHSPLTESLCQLWLFSPHQPPPPSLPQSQNMQWMLIITALGAIRHFPGLSELQVLLPPWQWTPSLFFLQNMPRRRVSVAVVPKFNALNLPSQPPSSSPIPSLPALVSMIMPVCWPYFTSPSGSLIWGWPRAGQGQQGEDISSTDSEL